MPLIAIEGADAVGKSTQVEFLKAFLSERVSSQGVALRCLHLPRLESGHFAELLQKFLAGALGAGRAVDPQLVALLFACDRLDLRPRLMHWLEEGDVVLMDRYVASNVAYQCAKLPEGAARTKLQLWIEALEYDIFGLPRPNLTLCFDAPLPFSLAQIAARRRCANCPDDVHEADVDLQRGVRQMYYAMAASDPSFCIVRCGHEGDQAAGYAMRTPEDIFEEVRVRVDALFL